MKVQRLHAHLAWLVGKAPFLLCPMITGGHIREGLRKLKVFNPMMFAHAAWGWGGGANVLGSSYIKVNGTGSSVTWASC